MNIGNLRLNGSLILAPMSLVTNLPFRLLCKKYGAALVYSEMTFSEAILRQNEMSIARGFTCDEERPLGIQLLGGNAESIVRSARIVTKIFRPELIDINLGCPAQSVIKNECGAALLKKPGTVVEIVEALSGSLEVPVTAKMRILNSLEETLKLARLIEKAGADALIVHGRTQKQQYSGKSNYEFIKNIKRELSIPVIANGDITDEKTAKNVLEYTQCDGLMIGRAAMGNPHIFRRLGHYLDTWELLPPQMLSERLDDFFEYAGLCRKYGLLGFRDIVVKAQWFTKGMKNVKPVRVKINRMTDVDSVLKVMEELRADASSC
jgi:nifR3 family TIM-barrel protein